MTTRGSYVHIAIVKFSGASQKCEFYAIKKKLMVLDKTIHKAFRTLANLWRKPNIEKFESFTIYQHYTLSLKMNSGPEFNIC